MIEVKMNLEKTSKNYVRYQVAGAKENDVALGALYIKQSALPQPWPSAITVKVEAEGKKE